MANEPSSAAQRGQPEPLPFPEIPGYRIEDVIGRGSTGVVYRAVQLAVDRPVALKVLHAELAGRLRAVRRLQREARTTARLAHPNIVSAIDMGQVGPLWWYAMELIDGPSLAERLREGGRLGEREALRLFIPLCEALVHVHEQGVVHRDIKPGNILIDRGGRARLVDLGLAFAEDDPSLTRHGGTLGTPHYVSPEQARDPQAADVRSDIWSLGASLFHAVCGRPPFAGESVAEILSGVLYAPVPDPGELAPRLSRNLQLVLRKCLSRDPQRRYPSPRELLEDLERIRERGKVSVRRSALEPVSRSRDPRRRALVAAAAVLAAGGLVWLAWARPWREGGEEPAEALAVGERWEELEAIRDTGARGDIFAATALTQLARLEPAVPPRHRARYEEVHTELRRRWYDAVARLRGSLRPEFERRLMEERDFVATSKLVGNELVLRVRTELNPDGEQMRYVLASLGAEEMQRRYDAELAEALATLRRLVEEHHQSVVLPRIENSKKRNAWRTARAELSRPVEGLIEEASIRTAGILPERLQEVLAEERARLDLRIQQLAQDWRDFDLQLERFVLDQAVLVETALERRRPGAAPADLDEAVQRRLAEYRLVPEEMLNELGDRWRETLERRRAELGELESRLLVEDARQRYDELSDELAGLWRERHYGEIRAAWDQALQQEWLAPVRERMRVRRQEADILEGLLVRAAEAVRRLDGQTTSILVGSIELRGKIDAGPDPLRQGFVFQTHVSTPRPAAESQVLALRSIETRQGSRATVLGTDAVEKLAGIGVQPMEPMERLLRALFRYRERDIAGAMRMLPLGPLPDEELTPLALDLQARLRQSEALQEEEQKERARRAEAQLNLVFREGYAHDGDREATLRRIEQLLGEFGDVERVRASRQDLLDLRDRLSTPQRSTSKSDLEELFGGTVEMLPSKGVSLAFEFDASSKGAWDRNTWVASGNGWSAANVSSREQLLDDRLWPRLVLRSPIDLDAAMHVELLIEQMHEGGPPRLLAISVAGVHAFFKSPEAAQSEGRFLIGSGGPADFEQHLDRVLEGRGERFEGLVKGAEHRIRIELSQGRGKCRVFLDDRKVGEAASPRPEGKPGTASIAVRSLEPVRLLAARIEARYR
jgi:hypothetical protein